MPHRPARNDTPNHDSETRVLLASDSRQDARLTEKVLEEEGLVTVVCQNISELCRQMEQGCGVVLLTARMTRQHDMTPLIRAIRDQPAWSAIPIVYIADRVTPETQLPDELGSVTVLRQPLHVMEVLSAVRSAVDARQRQYQVRDLLADQQRSQNTLREIDQRKDEFLATLAHELRNPIAPIQNALELLEISEGSIHDEDELRAIMYRQVRQLTRIVDDLLDVSRITRGKIRIERTCVDLSECIRSGVEASRPFIERSKQTLKIELPDRELPVEGDPTRLSQIVANLLNNAAKYTPAGGNIWLTARCDEANVHCWIRDDGIGIDADRIDTVFDLFEQHDIDRERGQAGLGIGLSLVQQLVQLHDGEISVHSDGLDLGSTFQLTLPLSSRSPQVKPSLGSASEPMARRRVLVVEDTRAIRYVVERLLRSLGHEVHCAEDGLQGLQMAEQVRPDLILSDISMPNMNGHQFAKKLRSDPRFDQTALVAMTGFGREEDRSRTDASGFDAHLTKPVDVRDLRSLLASL